MLFLLTVLAVTAAASSWEDQFRSLVSVARMVENEQIYTSFPHRVGTPEDKQTALFTLERFQEALGTEAAFLDQHRALTTVPITSSVTMTHPLPYKCQIKEDVLPSDPVTGDDRILLPSVAYSRSGSVTANLVYVNYGSIEDYQALPNVSIVRNSIALIRYGKLHRGIKVRLAEQYGAVGVILYSDPADDGFVRGPVYPEGPWRPPFSVQRGSCQFISICPGDPSTIECGGDVALHTPSIPVQPLGYGDAVHLLQNMGGPAAPPSFQGGFANNFTYTLGGDGSNQVQLVVEANWTNVDLWNVCVDIPGRLSSKKHVLLGNHHDAWTFGGSDPNSGSSVFLEVVRVFGELFRLGWMPDYRIRVCSWDGEESGLLGSTKYVLENANDIHQNLIAYLNTDVGVAGTKVDGSSSPSLASLVASVMSKVTDPATNQTLSEVYDARPFPLGQLAPLGSGSDFTSFWAYLGVPALDWGFRSEFTNAPYHSAYDDYEWMNKFGSFNGTYDYYVVLARLVGSLAMTLSERGTSLNVSDTAVAFSNYVDMFEQLVSNSSLPGVQTESLKAVAQKFSAVVSSTQITPDQSIYLDRQMQFAPGLPQRPFYKNLMAAPGRDNGYEPMILPGAWQAILDGNVTEANVQIANLIQVVSDGISYLSASPADDRIHT